MTTHKFGLKNYIKNNGELPATKKPKKSKRVFGLDHAGSTPDISDINESLLLELLSGGTAAYTSNVLSHVPNVKEEDEEQKPGKKVGGANKIDGARQLFQALINRPDSSRKGIIDAFEQKINVTHSTAVSYYERLAKEAGLTGNEDDDQFTNSNGDKESEMTAGGSMDDGMADDDVSDNEDNMEIDSTERDGIIRTVKNAHLIYKEQTETGTFDELWIYNVGKSTDEMTVRRAILAGTDIPPKKAKSPDGSQTFSVTTMGNAQYLHIKGLPN